MFCCAPFVYSEDSIMSRMFRQNVKGQDMGYEMISRPQDLKGKSKMDAFKSEGYCRNL